VTRIDRYVVTLFVRTVLISFCSLAGVFIVFHAFSSMDDLVEQARRGEGMAVVLVRYFGPYILLLFDWTAAIVAVMALLFTVGWLRRSGELTAVLSAGVSHGRLLRPMILAVVAIIVVQLLNRELVLPQFRDSLTMKARDLDGDLEQPVRPNYDRTIGILIGGESLQAQRGMIRHPNFTISADHGEFGDLLRARSARWVEAEADRPCGYLLRDVESPADVDSLASVEIDGRPVLLTSRDCPWVEPGECFVATRVDPDLLQTNAASTKLASIAELARRVRNPAAHTSASLRVLLHERIVRPPLDFALVMLSLPLVVNRRGKGLFVLIGAAVGIVLLFFAVKTLVSTMGGNGYLLTPAVAAWIPLLVFGPVAYVRLREVQTV